MSFIYIDIINNKVAKALQQYDTVNRAEVTNTASNNFDYSRFKGSANAQLIDLKIPLFGRGGISEDLKSILITV